ncbi:hypothetical protein R1flu_001399 [Riccia fluitans]|uniref:Uncharacterized protein n=1 Tax=Riccia fluitans TaxID=41844 RepID=A0ABD1Y360_9MARC
MSTTWPGWAPQGQGVRRVVVARMWWDRGATWSEQDVIVMEQGTAWSKRGHRVVRAGSLGVKALEGF